MNADSDKNRLAALVVKVLRVVGKKIRMVRGDVPTFYPQCTDLTTTHWDTELLPDVIYGAAASEAIYDELVAEKPSMICRFGTTELATISATTTALTLTSAIQLVTGSVVVRDIGLHDGLIKSLCKLSGFFPAQVSEGRKFVEMSLMDMPLIDVLGVWCKQEQLFSTALSVAKKVRFRDVEPYMHANPWSRALAGKKVLVIHPFAETIADQYARKREQLFANPLVLPDFELKTIKAVQSIANNKTPFATWFDALGHMKAQISATDFDIAIIGCGAYGMPLAAHCKRIGKKAVHLGGQTQLLFGIKGKRWETGHDEIKRMFNEHWVYPDEQDKPKNYGVVEGGAYW
jgi:hypothetical protein